MAAWGGGKGEAASVAESEPDSADGGRADSRAGMRRLHGPAGPLAQFGPNIFLIFSC